MCGIFGVISQREKADREKILAARDTLAHRGPDDKGFFVSDDEMTALAHRRLSIIDLSPAAHQPMSTPDKRYTIVYNGEIYNYVELRKKIIDQGISLKSDSDTEVILLLYSFYGSDCLNMLRGMFSFAVWDEKEKRLFAARDRFGIKPFYYLHNENEFIFSSEIKAIKFYSNKSILNPEGIDAFLKTGSIPAPLTIYKEINALVSGNYLELTKNNLRIQKYWTFKDLLGTSSADLIDRDYDNEARTKIKSALIDSINAHLVADVEVGAFLSGGIDSTAIVSLMRQADKEKIKTVSMVFPGHRLDESKYSRLAAEKYKTEHIEVPFSEDDLLQDLEKIMQSMDQPTIDGINTYFVSKAAKQAGLKVVLSGLGGDELFGGYPSFNLIPKYRRIKNLPFGKSFMRVTAPMLKKRLPAKAIEYMNNSDSVNAEYRLLRGLFTDTELKNLGWQSNYEHPYSEDGMSEITNEENLVNISRLESVFYMRNQLLRDSDVFSMANSLELRVPFVDHLLYSAVLPYLNSGYDKARPKKILLDAVGDLPDELVNRPKMGFTFPFEDWIKNGNINKGMQDELINLKSSLGIKYSQVANNKSHWSRSWSLYVLAQFI